MLLETKNTLKNESQPSREWIASQLRPGKDQVDVILFDFSKAFDKVPNQRMLHKLDYYGVRGDTLRWIQSFLSYSKQQVLLEEVMSAKTEIIFGVPQDTVLGFINDLPESTSSDTRLFVNDELLYRKIGSTDGANQLQQDLDTLQQWEDRWQMKFHPEKCQVIRICTNNRHQRETTYKLHGHILQVVDSAKYLGVTVSDDLQWKTHIENVTAKVSRNLGFLRRNGSSHNGSSWSHLPRPDQTYLPDYRHQQVRAGPETKSTLCY